MTVSMNPITAATMGAGRQMSRSIRRPSHPFNIRQRAFEIAPFFIAPVLPGETLKNLSLNTRCVTDPILNKLTGWWLEHYFFYVKLSQLLPATVASEMPKMLMDPAWGGIATAQAGLLAADNAGMFYKHSTNGLNFVRGCRNAIVRHWFRDELDDYSDANKIIEFNPVAQFVGNNVLDSAGLGSELTAADVNVDLNANATITTSEIAEAFQRYQALLMNTQLEMSWEDFLQAWGVSQPAVEPEKPELLRYSKDWQYPSNTVNPVNGTPTSAVSWSTQVRADKDRFFKEHGFIVGVSVCRPKVYLKNHRGSFSSLMSNYKAWLAPWLTRLPQDSFVKCAELSGPLPLADDTATGSYFADIKDLFMYGEQFVNEDLATATGKNLMAGPTADLSNMRYPTADTDVKDNLFVTPATLAWVRQDGIVTCSIASHDAAKDSTPRGGTIVTIP